MNAKSDADHHKNKFRKGEKIMSNHEADETKDPSTPQLQRIVSLQQYKLNKIKLEKEIILLETTNKQTVEKSSQNNRAVQAFVSQFEYNQWHQLQTANENVSATASVISSAVVGNRIQSFDCSITLLITYLIVLLAVVRCTPTS
ncbi:hypothetical protein WA026_001660 [Henosepilachna vigintioctopunctata]|uniref:Uncharacterized protein n=1 Tax=Henosepilachna vigintioctopunctata TaxID=420089 RepID=A0AAW1UU16_9CUCU